MAWPQFPTWQRPKGMLKCLAAWEQSVVMWIWDEFVGFASVSSCSLGTSPTWHYQITVAYRADCIKASCQADYVAHLGWGSMSLSISLKKQAGKLEMSVLDCEIPTTYLIACAVFLFCVAYLYLLLYLLYCNRIFKIHLGVDSYCYYPKLTVLDKNYTWKSVYIDLWGQKRAWLNCNAIFICVQ